MPKMIKRHGVEWEWDGELWRGLMHDRFEPMTWKFGSIWQCRIDVDHDPKMFPTANPLCVSLGVRVCLEPTKSHDASMKKAIAWVENYVNSGPMTWEQICRNCYDNFPTLFKRESDVIGHVFFTTGGGYGWLDGAIICETPEDRSRMFDEDYDLNFANPIIELVDSFKEKGDLDILPAEIIKMAEERREEVELRRNEKLLERETHRLPLPEPEGPMWFSEYISEGYANILCIPENVTDKYLLLCARIWHKFRYENANEKIPEEKKEKYYNEFHNRFNDRLAKLL